MFPRHGSRALELGTREPFGDILQDGDNIHKESTRNQERGISRDRFFRNLDIRVVIRLNVDTVRHRYWGRTNKTKTKKNWEDIYQWLEIWWMGTYVRTCCKKSLGFCKSWPRKRLTYLISRGWLILELEGLKNFVNIRRLARQTSP